MDSVYDVLIAPFAYDFMQRALIMSVFIATICSIFSCFLVLKGWSLMGDAISHAVLPGLAVAFITGVPLAVGALAAGMFCAVSTGYLKNNSRVKEDAIMGIVFSGMFALGLVLLTKIETDVHLLHVLFGNVLGISQADLIESGVISIVCSIIMVVKRKDLMLYCFDPNHARVIGLPVQVLHFGLLILLSLTIVSALKAAGIILVVAMLIAPGAIAYLLSKSFDRMIFIALAVSIGACLLGVIISFHFDIATAPLIVVIQAAMFIITLLTTSLRGARGERLNVF